MKKFLVLSLMLVFSLGLNSPAFAEIVFGPDVSVINDTTGAYQTNSSIAVDNDRNVYVAWADDRNGNYDIYFAKSTDGGATFTPNTAVCLASDSAQTYPSIAVDDYEDIYVAWQDDRNGNYDIYFAKSTDGGASFGASVRVDNSTSIQYEPSIIVDKMRNVYIVWPEEYQDIYLAKSTNGGTTFNPKVRVNEATSANRKGPSIAVDATGYVYVGWNEDMHIYCAKSTDGGATFTTPVGVDDSGGEYPSVAVDINGDIYVAWDSPQRYIYFDKSTDGGASFGVDVLVDSGPPLPTSRRDPAIAVDANSNIFIVWEDARNDEDPFEEKYCDVYFARSINGGTSFETSIKVNKTTYPSVAGTVPSIAVDSYGYAYVAWHNWGDAYDIFVAKGVDSNIVFPIANAGEDQVASANETVVLDGSGSYDSDGTIVNYKWRTLPDYLSIHSGPASTWEAKALGRAEQVVELIVTDNDGATATDTMVILNHRVNLEPPVIEFIGSKSIEYNKTLNFKVEADDPENFPLEYSASSLPRGATFNSYTQTFSWKPTYSQIGQYTVKFLVSDGLYTDYQDVTILVKKPAKTFLIPKVEPGGRLR